MPKQEKHFGKHILTIEETSRLTQDLCRNQLALPRLQNEKKEVVSSFKAKEDTLNARINEQAQTLNDGYEYKQVLCDVTYDLETKMKVWTSVETGEIIDQCQMTKEDDQMLIDEANEKAKDTVEQRDTLNAPFVVIDVPQIEQEQLDAEATE